jgi:hypothetical protein
LTTVLPSVTCPSPASTGPWRYAVKVATHDRMSFYNPKQHPMFDQDGGRVIFFRNIANVTMDLDDVESIDFRALGGADNIVVGDLSGTDVTQIGLDLRGPNGGGDGAASTVARALKTGHRVARTARPGLGRGAVLLLHEGMHYGVSVLCEAQASLSDRFAGRPGEDLPEPPDE